MTAQPAHPGVSLSAERLIALRHVMASAEGEAALARLPGGFRTRRRGQGIETADMREYAPGDDIRHIHRGATARTGRLHIRRFQEERDRVCLLVADFRTPMFWGLSRAFLSVAAAEALALTGWRLTQDGARAGLLAITPDAPVIIAARGKTRGMLDVIGGLVRAYERSLTAIMEGRAGDGPQLDQSLAQAARLTPAGAEIIIASGFDNPGGALRDGLDRLASRRSLRLLQISDAKTHEMPRGWYPVKLSDGRRKRIYLSGARAEDEAGPRPGGREALLVNAGDPVEITAQKLTGAFSGRLAS